MVNLLLKENRLLTYPTLYISYFLKRNRIEYYERLTEVREKGNFEQWVKFFMQGIYESAEDSIETIDALVALHDKNLSKISDSDTRTGILKKLIELGVLIQVDSSKRERSFAYEEYLVILRKDT